MQLYTLRNLLTNLKQEPLIQCVFFDVFGIPKIFLGDKDGRRREENRRCVASRGSRVSEVSAGLVKASSLRERRPSGIAGRVLQ